MKKFFAANYEKLTLGIGVLILVRFILSGVLSDDLDINSSEELRYGGGAVGSLRNEGGIAILQTNSPHRLMPGEKLVVTGATPEFFNGSFSVGAIIMPERSHDIKVVLKDGRSIEGMLKQVDSQKLDSNWRSASGGLLVGGEKQAIPFSAVERIAGSQELTFSLEGGEDGEASGEIELTTYQPRANLVQTKELPGGGVWPETDTPPEGEPSYDLFTPPVIYVVNGRLTTRLPEEPKPEKLPEKFGAKLLTFEKVPYRFRIRSWIGETPYLEDLSREFPPSSGRYVRSPLQPRTPYKENMAFKPGMPSLVATKLDDPAKLVMIEAFVVQQVRDPETGGIRPVGRVMLKDFHLGEKTFEINSLMETTHAGQHRIVVGSTLAEHADEKFTFEETSKESTFMLNEREYRILEIDTSGTRVHLEKQARDPPELQSKWLSLPSSGRLPAEN